MSFGWVSYRLPLSSWLVAVAWLALDADVAELLAVVAVVVAVVAVAVVVAVAGSVDVSYLRTGGVT